MGEGPLLWIREQPNEQWHLAWGPEAYESIAGEPLPEGASDRDARALGDLVPAYKCSRCLDRIRHELGFS